MYLTCVWNITGMPSNMMLYMGHLQTASSIFVLPVPCCPLISSMRDWTSMEKWVVCWASWGPQWWWSMPLRRRRLLPSVPWPTNWETQVAPASPGARTWKFWAGWTLLNSSTRFHCVCCVRCGEQPGSYLCCGSAVWTEECAGLHPDLLCDWLALCVLREGPGHRHQRAGRWHGRSEGATFLVISHLPGDLYQCTD